ALTSLNYSGNNLTSIIVRNSQQVIIQSSQWTYNLDGTVATTSRDNDPASTQTYRYTAFPATDCVSQVLLANVSDSLSSSNIYWSLSSVSKGGQTVTTLHITILNIRGGRSIYDVDVSSKGDVIQAILPAFSGANQILVQQLTYTITYNNNHQITNIT